MYVNILILIVYTSNYQPNAILYENMRNDFEKSFLVHIRLLHLSAIFRKNGHRQYTHLVYYISVLYLVRILVLR